jgi:prepilin-type N-terminal cleavage/methylation domain-containing protein
MINSLDTGIFLAWKKMNQKLGMEMKKSDSGFTLIELLVVVAIIGIIATVALPYYQGYMIRAKLVEVENAMSTLKSAVSSYRQDKDVWPDCPSIPAIRTSLGVGLGAIQRLSAVSISGGSITATITLRPREVADSSFSWVWEYDPTFPVQLRQRNY